jgi:serine/threonine-protein kinase
VTTVSGAVIGTPAYMAPEQAEGRPCGPQADVYAAATVLYELLSATLPFSIEGEPIDVLERRVHEEPTPITEAASHVPEPLATVTMRALQRDPDDRYPSAEAFGVAIGEAATESFGPGWLGRSDLTLLATGPIAVAAGPAAPTDAPTIDRVTGKDVSDRTGRETTIAGKGAPVPHDMPVRVRATAVHRAPGARLDELSPDDFVRVDDLIRPPKAPWRTLTLTSLLLTALIAISVVGLGKPHLASPLQARGVRVAGVDLASGQTVHADLANNVPVQIRRLPPGALHAHYVRLGFSVLGVELPDSRSAVLLPDRRGGFRASVDAQRVRILFAGNVTGEIRFLDGNKRQLVMHDFHMNVDRPFYLVATGLLGLLLLAFVLSYAWSLAQPLRRGRRRGYVGFGISGAIAGAAAIDLGWAIVGPQPTVVSGVVGIVLGALVLVLAAHAVLVLGRRRRLTQARARKEAPPEVAAVA